MSLFVREGKIKSTLLLNSFCLSLLYVIIFFLAYAMSADLVSMAVPDTTGSLLWVWGPPSLICICAALLCSLPLLFFRNKLLVPASFTLIGLYALLIIGYVCIAQQGETRQLFLQILNLYLLLPAIWGNLIGWGGYLLMSKNRRGD